MNIGQKFREAFQNHEVQPDPQIWQNISARIKPGINILGKKFTYGKIALISMVAAIFITASLITFYSDSKKTDNAPQINNTNASNSKEDSKTASELNTNSVAPTKVEKSYETPSSDVKANEIEKAENQQKLTNQNIVSVTTLPIQNTTTKVQNHTIKNDLEKNTISNTSQPLVKNTNENKSTIEKSGNESGLQVIFGQDHTICFGEEAILEVSEGDYSIYWENGSTSSKIRVKPMTDSEYKVVISNKSGQTKTHIFKVNIDNECTAIFIPTAFTPNNDGNNDVLYAQGVGVKDFYIQIMNRMGKIVFESEDMSQGWDASTIKNTGSAEVFIYIVKYTDARNNQRILKGQVTLIR